MGSAVSHQLIRKGKSMTILTVGIDLAKNVNAVHGVNEASKAELTRPAVPRDKLHELIASLPPCVIGMEACSGAHHWARLSQASGHTVRLIAPKFVTPYRMTGTVTAAGSIERLLLPSDRSPGACAGGHLDDWCWLMIGQPTVAPQCLRSLLSRRSRKGRTGTAVNRIQDRQPVQASTSISTLETHSP